MTGPSRGIVAGMLLAGLAASAWVGVTALRRMLTAVEDARAAERLANVPRPRTVFPETPIAAEAEVFRTSISDLAIDPAFGSRRSAHPRSLATYRNLRAYDGAPPRLPHGLSPAEYQSGRCGNCHLRGGFSPRFGAYAPVTPHPDWPSCLQCHLGTEPLMAIAPALADPSDRCIQCHAPDAVRPEESLPGWRGLAAPAPRRVARGAPPVIPHDLSTRGDCVTCHAAPGGVEGLRTRHADRANCRQCHLTSESTPPFARRGPVAAGVEP